MPHRAGPCGLPPGTGGLWLFSKRACGGRGLVIVVFPAVVAVLHAVTGAIIMTAINPVLPAVLAVFGAVHHSCRAGTEEKDGRKQQEMFHDVGGGRVLNESGFQ